MPVHQRAKVTRQATNQAPLAHIVVVQPFKGAICHGLPALQYPPLNRNLLFFIHGSREFLFLHIRSTNFEKTYCIQKKRLTFTDC